MLGILWPDVRLRFRGRGGEMSRARLGGSSISIEPQSRHLEAYRAAFMRKEEILALVHWLGQPSALSVGE